MSNIIRYYSDKDGKLLKECLRSGINKIEGYCKESEQLVFYCKNGKKVVFYHDQDCSECVWLEDGDGLVSGFDIFTNCDWCELQIETKTNGDEGANPLDKYDDSFTWSFYKFKTNKGYDTIRWYGTSNGYYSEEVDYEIWE
jgi:hypothetical protein